MSNADPRRPLSPRLFVSLAATLLVVGIGFQSALAGAPCGTIACGETVAGLLESPGVTDCFTFTAEANETVSVVAQETAGFFQACWTIMTPSGGLLGLECVQDTRTLPETGTYTIFVSDQQNNEAGAYDLNLSVVSDTASACAGDITCGDTLPGQLAVVAESDLYSFAGVMGDTMSITAQETGGGLAACWELYDPSGLSLQSACGQDERTLAVSGTYTIRVFDNDESKPGTYDLNVVVVSDSISTCASPISCGQTPAASLGDVGESATYRFASAAGETVSITAQETAGGLSACWELYDPQGIPIANACGQAEKRLAVAGNYTIRVHDQSDLETGTYDLSLVFVSDTASQCGSAIACGAPATASIGAVAESDTYRFTAAAGEAVSITAQETSAFLSACWELYDPDGISLGNTCGQSEKTLATAGDYTIRIYDNGDVETGTYDLAVSVVSDTLHNCGTPITCGTTAVGALSPSGESDTFAFTAAAGEAISVTAQETGGFLAACWELYDPTGLSLGTSCGQTEKTLPIPGDYTIRVYDNGESETGTYDLNLVVVSDTAHACAAAISCGQTVGSLDLKGESDVFAFAATVGDTFPIAADETTGSISACWEFYDPIGASLGFRCGEQERTAAATGVHTIRIYDQGDDGTGGYTLTVCTSTTTSTTLATSTTTTTTGGGSTTTSTTVPGAPDEQPLDGKKLLLKDNATKPEKRRMKIISKDPRVDIGAGADTADDPRLLGGSLRVSTTAGDAFAATYDLPRTGWRLLSVRRPDRGWKYRGDGAVRAVIVKAGKLVKVTGKGTDLAHTLGSDPAPVDVVLQVGARRYCLTFGGDTSFEPGVRFKATASISPASCPEADSATGAFVD